MATHSSDTTVAINEHALAAGEFAKAASGTGSAEALRALRLLERHHQRLSELLRYPTEHPPTTSNEPEVQETAEKPLSTSAAVAELRASKSDLGPRSSSPLRNPPSLGHPRRLPPRDLSSSIASNLASARGIRANYTRQPLSPSVSTQQAPGSFDHTPRKDKRGSNIPHSIPEHSQPSWIPPAQPRKAEPQTSTSKTSVAAEPAVAAQNDEGFSKFYSAFENILSRLSAPLAFAGLPLVSEESAKVLEAEPAITTRLPKKQERTDSDPDLAKFISRAALRASARDGHSGNDSFYVVPTTGHTVSYAHILSFAEKEKRRLANSIHNENPDLFADPDEDDFVDARETPMPVSPSASRRLRPPSPGKGRKNPSTVEMEQKVEELDMENQSLKGVVDKLSKRLHAFEMAAQNSSMALQESMRLMRDMSPARTLSRESSGKSQPTNGDVRGDEALHNRVLELEEHIQLGGKEIERLGRENEKLKAVVTRYRERWEKLKEGAKTRRQDGGKDGNGKDGFSKKDDDGAA